MVISNNKIECNNCGWIGDDIELSLVMFKANDIKEIPLAVETDLGLVTRISYTNEDIDFLKGCPNCLTDNYLKDL